MNTDWGYRKEQLDMIAEVYDFNQILDSFYHYLSGIVKVYEDILPIIKEELIAIGEKNISMLDENLKKQQALLFQTRGFDKKIAEYTTKLDLKANKLSAMVEELPRERRPQFSNLLERFEKAVDEVSFNRDKCKSLLQAQLYSIDKAIAENGSIAENKTYQGNATIGTGRHNAFETTV